LLVVIVILGIIAAIAIPAITSQNEKARVSAADQTSAVVKDAAQRYAAVNAVSSVTMSNLMPTTAGAEKYFQEAPDCPTGYTKATTTNADADLLTTKFCTKTP
jgi:type II secretory pathway pseudopilin PulG